MSFGLIALCVYWATLLEEEVSRESSEKDERPVLKRTSPEEVPKLVQEINDHGATEGNVSKLLAMVKVPLPDMSKLDHNVRQQLGYCQEMLTDMQRKLDVPNSELSAAFGDMGMLYHTYELLEAAEGCYRNAQSLRPDDFRWPYYLGQLYRSQGKMAAAIAAFERAMVIRPDSLPALINLAQTYLQANQPEQAESRFQRALENDATCAPAIVGLGTIAASRREFAEAVGYFELALKYQPEANAIHYPLAMAYRGMKEMAKARKHLELRGKIKAAIDDPLMAELRELPAGIGHLVQRGVSAGRAGQIDFALQELRKAVQTDPQNSLAHLNLGTALAKSGEPKAAIQQIRKALRLKPDFARAHGNLGVLLLEQGSNDEAIVHFRQAIRIDPQYLNAHMGLADALVQIGKHESAANHYARVIEIDPRHREARLGQAVALARAGHYVESRQRLEESRIVLPESMILAHALARLLATCPDETVRDGSRALQLALAVFKTRKTIDHAETLAMAHAEVGQYEQASNWQEQAIAAAQNTGQSNLLPQLQKNLCLYQRRQPCRVPWPDKMAK